ncbi:MAG TPA: hypothetical protein VNZ06_11735 [Steroidobacteraceae bacterium]|jgi:hypothetical protein|nr:hypothetical protein [Steroidobacteraceae bacterium]
MAKVANTITPEYLRKLRLYELAIAMVPGLVRKGASVPYTAVNGNMSSYLHPRGEVALRLAEQQRKEFLKQYKARLFEAYGIVQKEYVTVPEALLADTMALGAHFRASLDYVGGLKAKPPKKKAAQNKTVKSRAGNRTRSAAKRKR